jgi:alkylation response protein AidB-like acyl-CoA dehydrogenase
MTISATRPAVLSDNPQWLERARTLGRTFAERAAAADEDDVFVADNFAALKANGFLSAGVPAELGGGGASHAELCTIVRELARHCGSTALAFSMHTHQVAVAAWRWRHQKAPVEGLLKRVASENIVLLSSGGSDWLHGTGKAERVEGGYRINARKIFASGSPAGDVLMTGAVYDDPKDGPTVLHFGVPMTAAGVRIDPIWKVMGMRGTGSHDILLENVFIADGAIAGKRPQGKWNPLFQILSMLVFSIIYSAYVGVAEAARDIAVKQAARRRVDAHVRHLVGGMENELAMARLALDDMIAAAAGNDPGFPTTNRVFINRTLVARGVLATLDLAMQAAGGGAFYRRHSLERLFRDAQGARYHPLQEGVQRELAARIALGEDPDGTPSPTA